MTGLMRRLEFNLRYLLGKTRWDTGMVPPEVRDFVLNHPPGRALDMGCGTGTNLVFLAANGWQADGVDFSRLAVNAARRRLRKAGLNAAVWLEDVTTLTSIHSTYNYILDIGCYHQLSTAGRRAYRANLSRLMAPDCTWMMYGHLWTPHRALGHGLTEDDIKEMRGELELRQRVDGRDAVKPSVWLWFEPKN